MLTFFVNKISLISLLTFCNKVLFDLAYDNAAVCPSLNSKNYMQSEPLQSAQTVTIYKAPQKGKGQKLLNEGFQPVDFPYNPPYVDGSCYFAGPNDRSIAEEFNQSYQEGVLEVVIDRVSYDKYFKPLEYRYDEKDNHERIEVVIPQILFPVLNQFPRVLKSR